MTASIQTVIRKRQDKRNLKLALEDHRTRVAKAQKIQLTTMQKIMNVIVHVLMALMVLYCLIPLIWLLFSSTKTNEGLFSSFGLWFASQNAFLQNLHDTFTFQDGIYVKWLWNTILYAVAAGLGSTIFATFAGYAVATMRFPGRKLLLTVTLAFMSIPSSIITVPLYLMYSNIGLVGSMWSVIIPQLSNAFGLYLMIIFAQTSIPVSLLEAAKLDGANSWQVFWKVAFPLLSPGFVTVLLFALVGAWNNYFLPLIMLSDANKFPLTVGLNVWLRLGQDSMYYATPNNLILMGSLTAIIPLIIAFLSLQKYWQNGLSAGAVKQ